ncbi:MAG TPA: ATP-binding protein, partial [Nitrospiria bacterium]|nr:ATP-binding protein [Nitrospiria bacterium]
QMPEVREALANGVGSSIRYSEPAKTRTFYLAATVVAGEKSLGLVRLTLPLVDLERQVGEIRRLYFMAALFAFVLSIPVSLYLSRRLTAPLREMTQTAERIGRGDFEGRIRVRSGDELEELGEALNQTADALSKRFQEISEDRARLSTILNGMVEGVMLLDFEGRVLLINPALARMFDPVPPFPQGMYHYELIRHRELNEFIERVLTERKSLAREIDFVAPRERFFQVQASLAKPSGGPESVAAVLVFHDITELRRLERVRKDFVANVSHELRTPLTSIKGYIEALTDLEPANQDQAREFLEILRKHAERMENIVLDLLQLARIESGKEPIHPQSIPLKPFLEKTVQVLASQAEKKKQRVEIEAAGEVLIDADPEKLSQVVVNLLDNAIKYTPESGRITVGGRSGEERGGEGWSEIFVRDDGIGIPPNDLDRIFERFYRVDRARSRELGGTGLGLSIVKHIIEAHDGTIRVESRPGAGSTFTARFPRVRSPKNPTDDQEESRP